MEAIILAGGSGTRLRSLVNDVPKPMASVQGRPMLEWQLLNLKRHGIRRIILSVGYLADIIVRHFGESWHGLEISYTVEAMPLGTGGAIQLAFLQVREPLCYVLNGDSLFDVDYAALQFAHAGADLTMALKPVKGANRFGNVLCDGRRVTQFAARCNEAPAAALINGGIYLTSPELFGDRIPGAFSFENDFLPEMCDKLRIHHLVSNGFFIDIGVPDDYSRAQSERFFPRLLA